MACFTDDIGPLAAAYQSMRGELSRGLLNPLVDKQSFGVSIIDGTKAIGGLLKQIPLPAVVTDRTSLELTFLAGSSAYLAWQLSRTQLPSRLAVVGDVLVPGWQWFSGFWKHPVVKVSKKAAGNAVILESRRPGSDEVHLTKPKFQASVGVMVDGVFEVLGCVIRFQRNYLVGPDHVLADSEPKFIMGNQKTAKPLSIAGKERLPLAGDCVAILLTDDEFSKIGISEMPIAHMHEESPQIASVVGPVGKGTTGKINHDPTMFGRVIYHGSTLPGYSGASYNIGNCSAGMHQSGGNQNSGLSSSFIWATLCLKAKLNLEDSPEWLRKQFESGVELVWSHCGDPDYVQVRVNGKYHNVMTESMYAAYGEAWNQSTRLRKRRNREYNDVLESRDISGEGRGLKLPGVSSLLENSQELVDLDASRVMADYNKLSKTQQKNFRKLQQLPVELMKPTNSPVSSSRQVN